MKYHRLFDLFKLIHKFNQLHVKISILLELKISVVTADIY